MISSPVNDRTQQLRRPHRAVIGFDLLKILMKYAMADALFRTDFPLPARGEAATRR